MHGRHVIERTACRALEHDVLDLAALNALKQDCATCSADVVVPGSLAFDVNRARRVAHQNGARPKFWFRNHTQRDLRHRMTSLMVRTRLVSCWELTASYIRLMFFAGSPCELYARDWPMETK